jgi:hypothetical protein
LNHEAFLEQIRLVLCLDNHLIDTIFTIGFRESLQPGCDGSRFHLFALTKRNNHLCSFNHLAPFLLSIFYDASTP